MPYYFDSEVPVARRRAGKDLRVYRLRYGFSGPAVISKYVYEPESHYTMKRFIGHNGTLQSYENMAIPPPLQKIDPFGIEGFNQLYSVNKQKRWQVLEIARNDIAALQRDSTPVTEAAERGKRNGDRSAIIPVGLWTIMASNEFVFPVTKEFNVLRDPDPSVKLRVTVMGLPINSKFWSHSPENRVTRPEIGWLSEYHTVDQNGRVISGKTKRTSFSAIRKGENPSRRRKGRLIRPFVHTPVEMPVPVEEQNEIVLWERQAHIIYQKQDAYIPKRMVNTTDKMLVMFDLHSSSNFYLFKIVYERVLGSVEGMQSV
ncbi:unnamed protein product [Toxocara canis]|uniref:Cap n=1 Tax=Toxocara canis TaxID=6265 RepID=A0A183VCW6_TOXCA|nr:unnamed protein product [Toxocara canis]